MEEKKKVETKQYTKEEVDKILTEVDKKLTDFIKSDQYKDVLLMMGNLGKYSLTNQIYILLQNENAVTVNGMRGWNYLGRSIKPGEKALRIFAPITGKANVELKDLDGNPILDAEGNPETKEINIVKGFKPSYVFDISQTQGKELKAFKMDENTCVEDKDAIIKGIESVITKNGFTMEYVSEEELGKGCYGLCNHQEKVIKILENMSDLQTVSTIVHEAAHSLAHNPYKRNFEGLTPMERREIKEVEAESIACVVCSHLGLDTENFNFSYIAGWSDGDITKFRKNMDVIGNYSQELIEGIDGELLFRKKESEIKVESNPIITRQPSQKELEVSMA